MQPLCVVFTGNNSYLNIGSIKIYIILKLWFSFEIILNNVKHASPNTHKSQENNHEHNKENVQTYKLLIYLVKYCKHFRKKKTHFVYIYKGIRRCQ